MRNTVLTGLFACVVIAAASSSTASAEALDLSVNNSYQSTSLKAELIKSIEAKNAPKQEEKPAEEQPVAKVHTVAEAENLSSIAQLYEVSWQRIYNKNEQLAHPDQLKVGDQITIPLPDEELAERPLPQPPVVEPVVAAAPVAAAAPKPAAPTYVSRGSSAGNTYVAGYCTWYAKNMRPDLPNNLGHAATWVSRAAAQGYATGSAPQAGAIGQQGNHVVYVERVNGDGTVTVSEMNYKGLYIVSSRTVAASNFMYIY